MSLPFLPIVNGLFWNVPFTSNTVTESPVNGEAGKLIVCANALVFTKNLCPLEAVVVVEPSPETAVQGVPPPRPVSYTHLTLPTICSV